MPITSHQPPTTSHCFSRRLFLGGSGALLAQGLLARSQPLPYGRGSAAGAGATVSLIRGDDRRKNAHDALEAIDDQIRPVLRHKKYVVIKPNNVSTVNPLAATNADTLHGILDYLAPRFKGPVMIAEASAGETMEGFENFHYDRVAAERRAQKVSLIDLNAEAKYETMPLIDFDIHPMPVRLAARLLDPEAFVICAAILKTHNTVVATLSVKIDGFEGMEGNGPASGTPVPSRVAIASTDYIAADRVGVEAMGIDAKWIGYLNFCGQFGLGQFDLDKIEVRGEKIAAVRRKYRLHQDIERELQWMGPMTDLPPKLG